MKRNNNITKNEVFFIILAIISYFMIGMFSSVIILGILLITSSIAIKNLIREELNKSVRYIVVASSVLIVPLINLLYCRIQEKCGFIEGALMYIFIIIFITLIIIFWVSKIIRKIMKK